MGLVEATSQLFRGWQLNQQSAQSSVDHRRRRYDTRVVVEGAKADAALLPCQLHFQRALTEHRQAGVEKRRPAIGVPPVRPRPDLQNLHGSIDPREVGELFIDEHCAVRQQRNERKREIGTIALLADQHDGEGEKRNVADSAPGSSFWSTHLGSPKVSKEESCSRTLLWIRYAL